MLQVCLNGSRSRSEHPALPTTPAELAVAARAAVAAGAEDIHLHPKDDAGADTMAAPQVAAAVSAVRAAVPGIPVGVTTGAWTGPDRAARVREWGVLPDHASVNWHEDGAADLAEALLARGVAVEAGLFSGTGAGGAGVFAGVDVVERFFAWPGAHRVTRVLAEITDTDPDTAVSTAAALLDRLAAHAERPHAARAGGPKVARAGRPNTARAARPILLHGEDGSAWPVLALAGARGLAARIGLEDTLHLPGGSPAPDNAALVRAARRLLR
ncbi:3-keto-5-aminohexanoate cleavage protein [Nonomuraea sp. NPDC050310]|uniref:3-keto-5-aminohexanoate cleavage protein n=1 Tax=Nonomuraea sp. NPDC050310 TaxID=3154935 RepID=UPI0033FC56E1